MAKNFTDLSTSRLAQGLRKFPSIVLTIHLAAAMAMNKGFILCTLQVILLFNTEYLFSRLQSKHLLPKTDQNVLLRVLIHRYTCISP